MYVQSPTRHVVFVKVQPVNQTQEGEYCMAVHGYRIQKTATKTCKPIILLKDGRFSDFGRYPVTNKLVEINPLIKV